MIDHAVLRSLQTQFKDHRNLIASMDVSKLCSWLRIRLIVTGEYSIHAISSRLSCIASKSPVPQLILFMVSFDQCFFTAGLHVLGGSFCFATLFLARDCRCRETQSFLVELETFHTSTRASAHQDFLLAMHRCWMSFSTSRLRWSIDPRVSRTSLAYPGLATSTSAARRVSDSVARHHTREQLLNTRKELLSCPRR